MNSPLYIGKIEIDYKLAMAIMTDTANAAMRKRGAKKWNRADYNKGVKMFNKVYGDRVLGKEGE